MKLSPEDLTWLKRRRAVRRESIPAIRMEHVADKLRAMRNLEHPEPARQLEENPRLVEMLLFIEWMSHQPGGLEKATQEFLAGCAENIGTPELHAAEVTREGQFRRLPDLLSVWASIPARHRKWPAGLSARHEDSFNLWLLEEQKQIRAIEREAGAHCSAIMATLTPQYFWRVCAEAALELLPRYLAALCNEISKPFPMPGCGPMNKHGHGDNLFDWSEEAPDLLLLPAGLEAETKSRLKAHDSERRERAMIAAADSEWRREQAALGQLADDIISRNVCGKNDLGMELKREIPGWRKSINRTRRALWFIDDLVGAFLAMMDRHAAEILGSIAQTEVVKQIFEELDFGISSGVPVFIAGDSRYGKTAAHKTWCEAYPGRARLINTPPTGREWNFYTAHADAFGMRYGSNENHRRLSRDVQFIIKHSGLFLCYDEAHHLIPAKVSKSSKPWRMDWIRCHVLDCGNAAAFIATRQTYCQNLAQFVKVTHHQMEQWIDRMNRPLILPGELSRQDVLAVAAHNFPAFPKTQLEVIAAEALGTDRPHHAVKLLAKIAEHHARKAGRELPVTQDVNKAIAEWKSRSSQKDFENPHAAPEAHPGSPGSPCINAAVPAKASRRAATSKQTGCTTHAARIRQANFARELRPISIRNQRRAGSCRDGLTSVCSCSF